MRIFEHRIPYSRLAAWRIGDGTNARLRCDAQMILDEVRSIAQHNSLPVKEVIKTNDTAEKCIVFRWELVTVGEIMQAVT